MDDNGISGESMIRTSTRSVFLTPRIPYTYPPFLAPYQTIGQQSVTRFQFLYIYVQMGKVFPGKAVKVGFLTPFSMFLYSNLLPVVRGTISLSNAAIEPLVINTGDAKYPSD